MKNLLIPSTLESDTINAIKVAVQQSQGKDCTIFLALVNDIPNTYSSATFLRSMKSDMSVSQKNVLEYCRELIAISQNCNLKIHYQYGISTPLMRNLIEHLEIELTILTPSFRNAEKRIHNQFVQILSNCKCPILHLSPNFEEYDLTKAMYLEQTKSKLQIEDLQELIPNRFNFRIVSQAKIFSDQNPENFESLLKEAITKNKINLLIETRKPKKIKLKKQNPSATENFGLPILSLYEEIA
ncbi:hypothetical protein EOD40_05205 [Flavobacterium sufflavum]|uniref:Universal stress protein n=1 Tax=Flavobacterium sufflavum TaxID=1921138 RepID=A0A3S2URT6_9FLAO|nr:hypothetical protein [Flavobacterium sufflavum]RVT78632.1 hypothetical protein EOD40_05205 [Flavobacterium sufflavum]